MRIQRRIVFAILFAVLCVLAVPRRAEGSVAVSISFFHERLSPYGNWVVAGSAVFVPFDAAGASFLRSFDAES